MKPIGVEPDTSIDFIAEIDIEPRLKFGGQVRISKYLIMLSKGISVSNKLAISKNKKIAKILLLIKIFRCVTHYQYFLYK